MTRANMATRATCAVALLISALPAGADGYRTYVNERFGTTVEYPEVFALRDPPPANGDGQVFRTADRRARLTVFGRFNVDDRTPRQMLEADRTAGVDYGYAQATDTWFVLSGRKAGRITYQRCAISSRPTGIVGCFELDYPEADAPRWDAVVERLGRSLRFGRSWYSARHANELAT